MHPPDTASIHLKTLARRRSTIKVAERKYRIFTRQDIDRIPQLTLLPDFHRRAIKAVSAVLPFRVNSYVVEKLIDWSAVPDDPIYKLVFPQPGMLPRERLSRLMDLVDRGASEETLSREAREIQRSLNAQPGAQKELNVPFMDGRPLPGIQHKYRETVLFFPAAGQTCHSHCTYCFRWAQFTESREDRFESHETRSLVRYLRAHPEVSDVLITGGDPLVMSSEVLRHYVEPLLDPSLEHIRNIRIGTKSVTFWPHRFVTDDDSDDLLRLFEEVRASGRQLALMAHFSHPREMETKVARAAIRRIRRSGAVIRSQSPVVRGVNDSPEVWRDLWTRQVQLGVIPYYMFVARDTGAQAYFKVPLVEAVRTFGSAYRQVSGLGRTVRGPVMSCTPGKILVDGVARVAGEDVFVLRFLQGRDPAWVGRPFFAVLDPEAAWLTDLRPAFGGGEFFFEGSLRERLGRRRAEMRRYRTQQPVHWLPKAPLRPFDH
ncbi:MAG: KamA family radical SAM protein [Longimicrobiales bacterium]